MEEKRDPGIGHKLELLGIGASKDRQFKANLLEALWQIGMDIPVDEIREIDRLLESGVAGIPALLVDGRVVFQKVVPSVEDLRLVLHILLHEEPARLPVRNIVVPTDFSETAENAFRYALQLAAVIGANIRLVHIYQHKSDLSGAVLLDGVSEEFHMKQELLESLSQSGNYRPMNGTAVPVRVEPEMIKGSVVDELRNLSRRKDTDLIVMGTTGDSKLLGRWLGSISTEVARKAYCPVILVPKNCRFEAYRDIVYACDYHQHEENVLGRILSFAGHFKPMMHLVHVNTARNASPEDFQQVPVGGDAFSGKEMKLKLSKVANPDILDALIQYANSNKAGLIAMGTEHRPFLEDLFHRSLTREMAFNTSVPLMVIHFDD